MAEFPTYNLREVDRGGQRKLPQCCLLGDLLESGEWLVRINGQYPSCSMSRFAFLEEGQWYPITKLAVHYSGGYPSYTAVATLRFDDKSMGSDNKVEVVLIMGKKRSDPKYQQLVSLQKPI